MFGGSKKFDAAKFRSQCNLALVRVRLQKQKKQNMAQTMKREIADLVKAGDEGTAQIRAEQLMHDDYLCEALDILETQLSELAVKSLVVANCVGTNAPPDLLEILATVIYAAPRLNIPEFVAVRDQLGVKFGRQFVFDCANDKDHCVQPNVKAKLSIGTGPDQEETVYFYLKSICELYHVPYNREIIGDAPVEDDAAALGLPDVPGSTSAGDLPPRLSFGNTAPSPFPSVPGSGAPSPFPSVPSSGASPFPSVPGGARQTASPFPSVPGGAAPRQSASPFPSVPGGAAAPRQSASPFPSVPGGAAPRQSASPFPSVPGGGAAAPRASASAFPSVPGAAAPRASASAFPSAPGGAAAPRASASAFPSAPGGASHASAFPAAPGGASHASAFPAAPGGAQASAFPSTQASAMPTPIDDGADDALDGLDLPDESELPDFDDLTSRMEAIKKRR